MEEVSENPFDDLGMPDREEVPAEMPPDLGALPQLPAPTPREPEGQPARGPVDLADLDPDSAKSLVQAPVHLATSLLPGIDPLDIAKMAEATIDMIVARALEGSDKGICLNELARQAKIGRGRLTERFGEKLIPLANLAVRGVYAQALRRVFYEELGSHSASVGRRHNGVGTDKLPALPNSLRLLDHSLGSSDRHCPAGSEPLSTGTRWDRTSERFGQALPPWASSYKGSIPQTFSQHLGKALAADQRARLAFAVGMRHKTAKFTEELTPERFRAAFSRFVVVPPVPVGPPTVGYRDHAYVIQPGRDSKTVEQAGKFSRHFLLACGRPSDREREEFENASQPLPLGKLPSMYELGIRSEYAVEYRWSPTRHELGRYVAGAGARLEVWRLLGADGDEETFWRMLALVERLSQVTWTEACIGRWESDCKPGRQKAHQPESCAGVRALLEIANAGIVDALRRDTANQEFH